MSIWNPLNIEPLLSKVSRGNDSSSDEAIIRNQWIQVLNMLTWKYTYISKKYFYAICFPIINENKNQQFMFKYDSSSIIFNQSEKIIILNKKK